MNYLLNMDSQTILSIRRGFLTICCQWINLYRARILTKDETFPFVRFLLKECKRLKIEAAAVDGWEYLT